MKKKFAADLEPGDRYRVNSDQPFREVIANDLVGIYARLVVCDERGNQWTMSRLASEEIEVWGQDR